MLAWLVALVVMQTSPGFATAMRSPALRQKAACGVMAKERTADDDGPCVVTRVVESRGPRNRPVFMVFFEHEWAHDDAGVARHFEVFDETGVHLRWFWNANVLERGDVLLQPPGGAAIIVQAIDETVERSTNRRTDLVQQTVHVVSLAAPSKPMLSLIVGPPTREQRIVRQGTQHCETSTYSDVQSTFCSSDTEREPDFAWSWTASCAGRDCRLVVGPTKEPPVAVYTWRSGDRSVRGPAGGPDAGFRLYELDAESAE